MLGNALREAIRSLGRNALRSFLTVLGIVIGVGAVIAMVTLGRGAPRRSPTRSRRWAATSSSCGLRAASARGRTSFPSRWRTRWRSPAKCPAWPGRRRCRCAPSPWWPATRAGAPPWSGRARDTSKRGAGKSSRAAALRRANCAPAWLPASSGRRWRASSSAAKIPSASACAWTNSPARSSVCWMQKARAPWAPIRMTS